MTPTESTPSEPSFGAAEPPLEFEDGIAKLVRRQRRRRVTAWTLGIAAVAGIAATVWLLLLRQPSPATTCDSVHSLLTNEVESADERRDKAALAGRVAGIGWIDEPEAFDRACQAYFGRLEESADRYGDDRYGFMVRCITLARSAKAANECIETSKMTEVFTDGPVQEYRVWRSWVEGMEEQ